MTGMNYSVTYKQMFGSDSGDRKVSEKEARQSGKAFWRLVVSESWKAS